MIVPMRKLSLLIYHQDYQSFLEELRERGVVHIYEDRQRAAENETLQAKLRLVKRVNEMIRQLEARQVEEGTEREPAGAEGDELLLDLEEKVLRQQRITQELGALEKETALYEPWGRFSGSGWTGWRQPVGTCASSPCRAGNTCRSGRRSTMPWW